MTTATEQRPHLASPVYTPLSACPQMKEGLEFQRLAQGTTLAASLAELKGFQPGWPRAGAPGIITLSTALCLGPSLYESS